MSFDKDGKEIDPYQAEIDRTMSEAFQEHQDEEKKILGIENLKNDLIKNPDGSYITKDSMFKFLVLTAVYKDIFDREFFEKIISTESSFSNADEYATYIVEYLKENSDRIALTTVMTFLDFVKAFKEYVQNNHGNKEI